MNAIWTVARRELKSMFDQPMGYILLVVFLGINNFLFFRQAYLFNVASLRPMLELMPWIFLFFVPAVTMRALAEDRRSGTIEVVLAQPLTELSYLLGKYVGQVLFVWIGVALTLLVPLGLSLGADLHVGVIVAQYVGTALLAAGLVAVGVWASSLTHNQITAFIIGVFVMFVLVLLGLDPLLLGLPPALGAAVARLGVLSHFRDIARGVIDLRDVIYFVTLSAIFLSMAYAALMSRKLSHEGDPLKRLRLGVAIIVVGLVVVNLFGRRIGGRLDLTPGNAYTLSDATRELVSGTDDLLTLKLFVSEELPPEIALLRRDIDDLLRDYRNAGGGNVRLVVQDPAEDPDVEAEARTLGIPPVQFNVVGESQLTVRDGFLGLSIHYADQTEVIPFIQRTEDLEYRLSSYIRGMTDTSKVTIGFYVDPTEQSLPGTSYQIFRNQLGQTYDVMATVITADTVFPDDVSVAVLIGSPDSLNEHQRSEFQAFFDRGGSALVLASGMSIGQQQFAMGREVAWNRVLEPFGLAIPQDMAFDLVSNESVSLPTQFGMRIFQPYPLWLRAISTQANTVNQGIETVFLPWASTVDTSGVTEGTVTPLFVTSQGSGAEQTAVMLEPNRSFPQDSLGSRVVAALVNPLAADEPSGPRGRVAVVGNSRFLVDQFVQSNSGNVSFALNAVDWLAQDESLIAIRAKNRNPPALVFSSETMATVVKYFNVFGVAVVLVLIAAVRLFKRRQRTRMRYQPLATGAAT